MNLAILDIDGTLTDTCDVDAECFLNALVDCFALADIEIDWSVYTHATDAGILEELFQRHFMRSPATDEIAHMQNTFAGHLQRAQGHNESAFSSVKGAGEFLIRLNGNRAWASVVATGGWAPAALFKLQAANLSVSCPIVSSDHGTSREVILKKAIETSQSFYHVKTFSRIVSVGDGVWDVRAAKSLRLPFVGIARGTAADRLRHLGVSNVLPDFMNLDAVFKALDEAVEPSVELGIQVAQVTR